MCPGKQFNGSFHPLAIFYGHLLRLTDNHARLSTDCGYYRANGTRVASGMADSLSSVWRLRNSLHVILEIDTYRPVRNSSSHFPAILIASARLVVPLDLATFLPVTGSRYVIIRQRPSP